MPPTRPAPQDQAAPSRLDGLRLSSHLYLAVGMALLLGMLVASYMQASAGLDAMRQFGLASLRASHLDRLSEQLLDAQAAARGYALTHNSRHLASYRATAKKIPESLAAIRREHSGHAIADDLIRHAQVLAAHLDITTRHIERGAALDESWFDQGTVAMDAYRRQHNAMKAELLSENLSNVRQSISGFENARISAVLLAIASLLLLVLTISQKQKKHELREKIQHLLEEKNEQLEREVRNRTEELTNLATYLTRVRETEKLHLAREMHDELGALLTAAKLDADWIERKLPPESQALVAQRMVRLRQSLISGITLKRRITNDLRPALLYDLGLIEAMKALITEFRESEEIEVKLLLPEVDPELSEALSLSLFRIVQEALTNIRKYAQAKHVDISLSTTPTTIELVIADDGIGFDLDSHKVARHGLAGIKHRVFTHEGELDIRTSPGAGVTLRVVLPL